MSIAGRLAAGRVAFYHWFWARVRRWAAARPEISLLSASDPEFDLGRMIVNIDVPLEGKVARISVSNTTEWKRWRRIAGLSGREREEETVEWIKRDMDSASVLFDIGANVGNFTVIPGILHPGIQICSFEPEPNSYLQLCRNIRNNRLNATAYCVAVTDRVRTGEFNIRAYFEAGQAQHQLDDTHTQSGAVFEPVFRTGCVAASVDWLVYEAGLPPPTHIKIDIDGQEELVLDGMRRTLAEARPHSVLCEVQFEDRYSRIRQVFSEYGYRPRSEPSPEDIARGYNLILYRS